MYPYYNKYIGNQDRPSANWTDLYKCGPASKGDGRRWMGECGWANVDG